MNVFWRLIPGVRPGERQRVLFFAALSASIGAATTLAQVGAETIFLVRAGPEQLPLAFVLGSAATVAGMLAYAAVVGRLRNDVLFAHMMIGAAALLCAGYLGMQAEPSGAPFALLAAFYLVEAVLLNHFWTFSVDYFDTPTLQRLAPIFAVGLSLGGALGGVLALGISAFAGPEGLILAWAACLVSGALLLRRFRSSLWRWGPLELEEGDEGSVEGLLGAVRFIRGSRLGQWLVASTVGLILAEFVLRYLYLGIFARSFPDTEALARFLALYLGVTNVVEVLVGLLVLPWLIRRFGAARANLIHPALFLAAFALLATDLRLGFALFARVNAELVYSSVGEPLRHLLYNGLPYRFRGRIRALLEGIVLYSGMAVAGAILFLLPSGTLGAWLAAGGIGLAAFYLLANVAVSREYASALVRDLRRGSLDLSEVDRNLGRFEVARLAQLWSATLASSEEPSRSDLKLAALLADRRVFGPLLQATTHRSPQVRHASIAALADAPTAQAEPALRAALGDPDAGVRRAALTGCARHELADARLQTLQDDPDPQVRAAAAALAGEGGDAILCQMAAAEDPEVATAALSHISARLVDQAIARAEAHDPRTRAAALDALARIGASVPRRISLAALAHPATSVRSAGLGTLEVGSDEHLPELMSLLSQRSLPLVETALAAVARLDTPAARAVLREQLANRVERAWRARLALRELERHADPALRFLRLAFEDLAARERQLVFAVLRHTEDSRLIQSVERTLLFAASRARGDALEVLSNLADREVARRLVLLLDDDDIDEKLEALSGRDLPQDLSDVLDAAAASGDHWLDRSLRAYHGRLRGQSEGEEDMDRLLLLRRVPLFARLNLDQLEAIDGLMTQAQYVEDELICREGDPGDRLFVLVEGEVDVFRNHGTERALRLGGQSPVSAFGEIALLDDSPRSATVVAKTPCRLLTLQGARLKELVLQMPEIAFDFFQVLTARVRAADQRLDDELRR